MSTIIVYKYEDRLRIGGGLRKCARVEIFSNEFDQEAVNQHDEIIAQQED